VLLPAFVIFREEHFLGFDRSASGHYHAQAEGEEIGAYYTSRVVISRTEDVGVLRVGIHVSQYHIQNAVEDLEIRRGLQ
jgi:hypothetical protein